MQTSICWGKTTLTIKFRLPRSRKWWRIFYHNIDNARIYTNNVSVAEQITISESLCENHWELHFCFSSRHLILAYEAGQSQMPLHQIKFAKWLWLEQKFNLFEKSIEKFSYFNSYINFISIKMRNKYKWWALKFLCRNWIYYSAPNRWTMDGRLSPHPLPLTDTHRMNWSSSFSFWANPQSPPICVHRRVSISLCDMCFQHTCQWST